MIGLIVTLILGAAFVYACVLLKRERLSREADNISARQRVIHINGIFHKVLANYGVTDTELYMCKFDTSILVDAGYEYNHTVMVWTKRGYSERGVKL